MSFVRTPALTVSRLIPAAFALAVFLVGPTAEAVDVGTVAPSFNLMDLDGRSWSLSDQTGKIALLFFFGHNATVCEESAPRIQSSVQDRYATRGLLVLGIECWNGTREQVQRFAEHTSVDYPLLLGGRDVASDFGLSYHSFVLVDGRGIVRYVNAGPDDAALDLPGLESAISTLLEEANEAVTSTWGQIKTLYGRKLGLDGIGAQIPGPGPS